MLNFRKFPSDWILAKILNGVQKASNWALNIGKNTHAPMEGWFIDVHPKRMCKLHVDDRPYVHILHTPWLEANIRVLLLYWLRSRTLSWSTCILASNQTHYGLYPNCLLYCTWVRKAWRQPTGIHDACMWKYTPQTLLWCMEMSKSKHVDTQF